MSAAIKTDSKSGSAKGNVAVSSLKKTTSWPKSKTNSSKTNKSKQSKKKRFQGSTAGLEDHIFYYGKGMDTKYLLSKDKLMTYIGKKCTTSERISIEKNAITLVGMVRPQVFAIKAAFELLSYTAQEEWKIDLKKYQEARSVLHKNLTSCYSVIWGQMSNTLRNKV